MNWQQVILTNVLATLEAAGERPEMIAHRVDGLFRYGVPYRTSCWLGRSLTPPERKAVQRALDLLEAGGLIRRASWGDPRRAGPS